MLQMDQTLCALTDAQGGCERIKRTPMPRGYGFIAERLLLVYSCVFPLCVVAELHWWTVPVNLVVCLGFALISEAGRVLEDPFTMFYNGPLVKAKMSEMMRIEGSGGYM
jgi:putative membrane protein